MLTGSSIEKLDTCNIHLQRLVRAVAEEMPIQVICGHRGEADQNKAFAEGKSKLQYPNSKHNSIPSNAVDIAPLKIVNGKRTIDWDDLTLWREMIDKVKDHASRLGIPITCGADWRMRDWPHIETRESKA